MPNPVIRSQTVSIGDLLRLGSFQPARVQRDYCWTEHQQVALLEDLIATFGEFGLDPEAETQDTEAQERATDAPFEVSDYDRDLELTAPYTFVGTVVLHPAGERFDIYDGLQRVTTFTVVFAVLRDMMAADKNHPVHSLLANESGIWRLNLQMKHNTLESDILAAGRTAKRHRPHPLLTDASERLRDCVTVARGMFSGWSQERLSSFTAFLSEAVLVTVTRISDRRIAAKAFVSINSGGLPLKPEEIVKGQLIDLSSIMPNADEAARTILFAWNSMQEELGKQRFDDFLRSVDFIERRMPQSTDYAIQLMEHIRRRYPGQQGYNWATVTLIHYLAAFKWIYESVDQEWAVGVHASLRRLQLLKWDQWRAYAMLIRMKSRPSDLDKRIDVLDRVCFALTVSTPDARRCAEMIGKRVERFAKGTFGKQGGFTFTAAQYERLVRHLNSPITEGGRRSTIMRWIEAAAHGDRVPRYVIDTRSSIEHVYPRNPQDHWQAFEHGLEINQLATLREMIGNLCVLPQDELGNASYEEKRKAYLRFKAKFANEVAKTKFWTPDAVRYRTKKLTDQAINFLALDVSGA
ncbi:MAG: DUF262 domain-containing protein [Hyphomonadaceae bacterium]|nr:DUF262 domain-containing protein [Hyphomonadaceae bacterium]